MLSIFKIYLMGASALLTLFVNKQATSAYAALPSLHARRYGTGKPRSSPPHPPPPPSPWSPSSSSCGAAGEHGRWDTRNQWTNSKTKLQKQRLSTQLITTKQRSKGRFNSWEAGERDSSSKTCWKPPRRFWEAEASVLPTKLCFSPESPTSWEGSNRCLTSEKRIFITIWRN